MYIDSARSRTTIDLLVGRKLWRRADTLRRCASRLLALAHTENDQRLDAIVANVNALLDAAQRDRRGVACGHIIEQSVSHGETILTVAGERIPNAT